VLRRLDWHDVRSAEEQRRFARDALAEYERGARARDAPARRFPLLIEIAKAASKAGKHDRASEVATIIFATEPELVGTFTYNRAIHFAHIALGNRALAGGDVTSAREHLFAAGSTNANFAAGEMYGPDYSPPLLTHGRRDAVIDYRGVQRALAVRPTPRGLEARCRGRRRTVVPDHRGDTSMIDR
jgi:hypothetical protein